MKERLPNFAVGNAVLRLIQTAIWKHMEIVAWGECMFLDAIVHEARMPSMHVLDRHKRILDVLERDRRFEKFLFKIWLGNREGLARAFHIHPVLHDR